MAPTYATLAECKAELRANLTVDDAKMLNYARMASARIDRAFMSRRALFFPYSEQREWPVDPARVNTYDNTFYFDDPLLALSAVSVAGTAVAVTASVDIWPALASPAYQLRLKSTSDTFYSYCVSDGTPPYVAITGVWGMHRDYPNAWLNVDTLAAAITTTTATTLTVADVDGSDAYGRTPRISAGNLVKIDSEYLEVVSTNTSTNVVTVRRGLFGTTAATHLISADVAVWQVEEPVKRACARQASFMAARIGAYETTNVSDLGVLNFPSDLLAELRGIIQDYSYT